MSTENTNTDVIFAIIDPYMGQILDGTKNYEFRKYLLEPSVKRIWFYRVAEAAITHICEILPARTRNPGDQALEEGGLGNEEYNRHDPGWAKYDFAYRIVSVYELLEPISPEKLKAQYGLSEAPHGVTYVPSNLARDVIWSDQKLVLENGTKIS